MSYCHDLVTKNTSQGWAIQLQAVKQAISALREQGDTQDHMFIIARILDLKDAMLQQILSAILYKKTVIWTDLKINPGGSSSDNGEVYATQRVFEMQQKCDAFMQNLGYLPTKLTYNALDPDD